MGGFGLADSGIDGIRKVGDLADPVNQIQVKRELSKGLILERKTVPIGVIGFIFESRPITPIGTVFQK